MDISDLLASEGVKLRAGASSKRQALHLVAGAGAQALGLNEAEVFEALMERHPEQLKREDLKIALAQHTRSTRYLQCVASGAARHDLDGQPVEPVAPEHVHHAIMEVFKRRQGRSTEDLRPALRRQLVSAFERSGLSPSDYLALVQGRDESANQLVQEALHDAEAQSARRQALQRAYEASGKPVDEFAQMYGMDVREVRRLLSIQ